MEDSEVAVGELVLGGRRELPGAMNSGRNSAAFA